MKKIVKSGIFMLLALSTAFILVLASCKKKEADGVVTLSLWHIWASETESSKAPFEKVLADFQAANPNIKIVVDATENEAYKQKIRATVAAGEAPDIFFYWAGGYMKGFVNANALLPLNDYIDDVRPRILPGTMDNMTFGGKIYGMPYSMSVGTLFVNTELFEQNGIALPSTWDELLVVCSAFLAKGIQPLTVGAKEPWCIDMYTDIIGTRQAGAKATLAALDKTASFNTPDFIEAGRKLQELVNMGAFGKGALAISRDESEVPFYEGKIPMYFNGSWTVGNVMRPESKIRGKVKIIPFPALGPNSNLNEWTGGVAEMFVVNSKTKHKDEAVAALKYITEHLSAEVYLAGVGLPTWNVDVDTSKIDPLTQSLVELTKTASSYVLWWNTALEGADSVLYDSTDQALFAGQLSPEQFAAQLATIKK